jgi:hypothetical protein
LDIVPTIKQQIELLRIGLKHLEEQAEDAQEYSKAELFQSAASDLVDAQRRLNQLAGAHLRPCSLPE